MNRPRCEATSNLEKPFYKMLSAEFDISPGSTTASSDL